MAKNVRCSSWLWVGVDEEGREDKLKEVECYSLYQKDTELSILDAFPRIRMLFPRTSRSFPHIFFLIGSF